MKKLNLMFCILMSLMAPLYAQTSLNENIALNKPVFVSSIEHGGTPAAAAVDGNLNSRWSSQFADPQWIYVDLGAFYDITQVRITWEAAMARNYRLEVSNDGMNWGPSAITTVSNNSSLVNTHTYTNVSGRFLRMFGTARVTPFGYSIYELEVFGTINQAPNITLTNLTSLQRFSINDNIVFTADASDPDGTIASVQFRLFGNVVGTDNTAPYEFAWTNANVGFFTVSAVAIDNKGATTATTAITISVVNNSRPSVSLTAPVTNSVYSAPAAVTLTANASDVDGTISSVRFFANGTSLGIDNSAPYEFNWSNVAAGNYTITAVATDNSSLTTTSSAVNITVNAVNTAPNVTLTNLTSLQRFSINDNIVFTADASDPDGTIASVQFRLFGNVVGTDNTAPYEFAWTNANVGFFTVSAVAIDNQGATTATTAITISVVNNSRPSVSLTAPAGNSIYSAPAAITLRANASDLDGTISSVRFFANGTSLGIDNSAPYEFNWSNVAAGNYTITAVATDNSSLTTTSSAVNIIVNAVNPAPNIALNKTVVASSIEHGGTPVHAAVDGDLNSRWSSQFADPQWIYVDLGASYSINEIKIIWETAMARDYVLEISNDFNSWGTPVIQVTNNSSVVNTHAISNISGRYVRMYGTARTTPYGYSIYELEVYGTPSAARVAAGNVEAEESANILKAFPIPAIDALTITGKTAANEAEIQLLNQMGTLLKTERYESGDQLLNKTISVSDLSEGFYFIKIISGGKTESIRFNK
jgi:hypothetical protein